MKELYDSYTESIQLLSYRIRELRKQGGQEKRILPLMAIRHSTVKIRAMIRRYINEDYQHKRTK